MKCSKCGAKIEYGELICTKCGTEIQLVPDFYSSETVQYAKRQKEREERERERRKREEEAALEKARRKKKRRKRIGITVLILVVLAAAIFAFYLYQKMKNYNSYDYQLNKAKTMLSNSEYEDALTFAKRAVTLKPDSMDARTLRAQIYLETGEEEQAVRELTAVIADDPDYDIAYGILINFYESGDMSDEIKELLDSCDRDKIIQKYSEYICKTPEFSIPEGLYDEPQELVLKGEEGVTIYYTTDGTEPDRTSDVYNDTIGLEEGTVTVKAMSVNGKGIKSDVVSSTYTISVAAPAPPKITPSSGSYTTSMTNTKIYVIVPDGCEAYYSFDKPATVESTPYKEPVDMKEGEHTFYAILVNRYGKVSLSGSATYILNAEGGEE